MNADLLSLVAWFVVISSLSTGFVLMFGGHVLGKVRAARINAAQEASTKVEAESAASAQPANDPDRFTDAA
ncbi:hypothetical protein KHP57_01220 [Algiphilus sp. NNCM1]|uniref:hypothetical protein n=1 Tax=Algiphilus sp. TaxID=1872431 RepID=UPI001CA63A9A|nr:hypothetical protein [Algiphilus sp.]MBY8964309.1 hypothetical protein [Algiphilus acroporae]MCI5063951.1 hypothetical protein [Algiphilus sp.]MCI5104346.1 hypothetical protein [Algiphilus sp.]